MTIRTATLDARRCSLSTVQTYLPDNYSAIQDGDVITIKGEDRAGWTLDGYVIPRLASGLYFATETTS